MAEAKLQDFYETKYGHEARNASIPTIKITTRPTDRFESAAAYLPGYLGRAGAKEVIELGAGNGAVAKSLLERCPSIQSYTLGDISMPRVEGIAANLRDPRVRVLHLDAEAIGPEYDGKFDAVVMIALIEHLIDPLSAMRNLRRLLKPGGFAYIDTPNVAKYTRRAQLLLGRFPSTAAADEGLRTYEGQPVELHDEGHLHYFTYRSLSRMLAERCGFSRIDKLGYPCGKLMFGRQVESWLAPRWPEAFSELVVVAHA